MIKSINSKIITSYWLLPKEYVNKSFDIVTRNLINNLLQYNNIVIKYDKNNINNIKKNLIENTLNSKIIIFKWTDLPIFYDIIIYWNIYISINNYYSEETFSIPEFDKKLKEYHWQNNMWKDFFNLLKKVNIWIINPDTYSMFKKFRYNNIYYIPRWVNINEFSPKNIYKNLEFTVWFITRSEFLHKWINIISELQEKLRNYWIKLNILDSSNRIWIKIDYDLMVNWYNSLHIFLIFSEKEWAPNSLLEAAACWIPIIATNVWYVKDIIWNWMWIILKNSTIDEIVYSISKIKNNYDYYLNNSIIVRNKICENYSWEIQSIKYTKFLNSNIVNHG